MTLATPEDVRETSSLKQVKCFVVKPGDVNAFQIASRGRHFRSRIKRKEKV
jgi:hypothetical protein